MDIKYKWNTNLYFIKMNIIVILFLFLIKTSNGFLKLFEKIGLKHNNRNIILHSENYNNNNNNNNNQPRKYSLSSYYFENYLRRLNSKNETISDKTILGYDEEEKQRQLQQEDYKITNKNQTTTYLPYRKNGNNGLQIIISGSGISEFGFDEKDQSNEYDAENNDDEYERPVIKRENRKKKYDVNSKDQKSENFEVITNLGLDFRDIGGYEPIKEELIQCIDLLKNNEKYAKFNVRIPKGLIFEGPPGNGKTLIAKALAGEAKTSFITVSGSEFQEKYVGVGASRIRELFGLAKKNIPCIIFIDEIDALGRKRASDGDSSSSERDSTLNELLVSLDGCKNMTGIFVIGATNRADLLDSALMRPGRIDKRIYIGLPDSKTRERILTIHIRGKPHDLSVILSDLIEQTNGLSGAQIENLLNEAMLNALRQDREVFTSSDIEYILNKMMVGWQPTEHQFTNDIIDHIAIHEMGHAVVGMLSKHHANITKVIINLSAPKSPAYTVFEASTSSIFTREALFEHLMILLSGRIAEEVIYNVSVTTGAINDFEEALKLAEKMIVYYGMGKKIIYPSMSDKYKEMIDEEINTLIDDAYGYAEFIIRNSKDLILEGAEILKQNKIMKSNELEELIEKHIHVLKLRYWK